MSLTISYDPNELRQSAARKMREAKHIDTELEESTSLSRIERKKMEDDCFALVEEADAEKKEANRIEADEERSAQAHSASGINGISGINDITGEPTPPTERGYRSTSGEAVAILASNESVAEWRQYTGQIPAPRHGEAPQSAGEAIRQYLVGGMGAGGAQAAQSGGSHTAGGYVLSPIVSASIIDQARSASVVVQAGARTVDMKTSELVLVKVDNDPTVSWTGENTLINKTSAAFGRLTFRARKLGAIVPLSIELMRDAPNAGEEIERLLSIAVAQEIDRAALLGEAGGEEPTGLFNTAGVTENAIGGAVDWDDYLDSLATIEGVNGMPGTIIMPPTVKRDLAKLKTNSEANHYATAPADIQAMQKLVTTKLASSQSVIGDFTQLMIGVRSGLEIVASDMVQMTDGSGFEKDQMLVKIRWRGDVQVAHPNHFEKLTGIS